MSDEIKEVTGVFSDIEPLIKDEDRLSQDGASDVGRFKELSIGEGSNVLRSDNQGIWLGAETFGTAPWSVSMNGTMYFFSSAGGGYMIINSDGIVINDGQEDIIAIGDLP